MECNKCGKKIEDNHINASFVETAIDLIVECPHCGNRLFIFVALSDLVEDKLTMEAKAS